MPGWTFTVAQQKGGAGKTTLAAHLAVAWATAGRKVAIVDIDPQGSLSRWYDTRCDALGERAGLSHVRITGWRTEATVGKLAHDHDIVVIDSPPHAETEARLAVRVARLVIVPVQPSPMDLWATRPTLDLARQEKVPVLLVANRVPPRARLADTLLAQIQALAAAPEIRVAASTIGNRIQFAAALLDGRSVTETARRTLAAREIADLAAEVLTLAG